MLQRPHYSLKVNERAEKNRSANSMNDSLSVMLLTPFSARTHIESLARSIRTSQSASPPPPSMSTSLRSNMKNEFRVNSGGRVGRWNRFRLMPLMDLHKSCFSCMHKIIMACQLMDDVRPDEWRMRKTKVQPFWMEIFFDLQFKMWFHYGYTDVVRIER